MNQATRVLLALLMLAMGCGASATETTPPPGSAATGGPHPVTAELIAEHASIQPGGGRTRVGVHFDLEEGWHIYADPPGDAGLPTAIKWSGDCLSFLGHTSWPAPQTFQDPGNIRTYGYDGTVTAFIIAYNSCDDRSAGQFRSAQVSASVKWLACREICIPGSADLELALPVATQPPALSTHAEFFDHAE